MNQLNYNDIELHIGDSVFSGLRVRVSIKAVAKDYSRATAFVYGMAKTRYDALEYYSPASIYASSNNGLELLYSGIFKLQQRYREGASTVSQLTLFSSIDSFEKQVYKAFEKGATGNDVISFFKEQLAPVELILSESVSAKVNAKSWPGGFTITTQSAFTAINAFFGTYFNESPSFDVNEIYVGERDVEPILISKETGMIDVPSFKKTMVKKNKKTGKADQGGSVTSRLVSSVQVLGSVDIQSENFKIDDESAEAYVTSGKINQSVWVDTKAPGNGVYTVMGFEHDIDTHGQEWNTRIDFINKGDQ